MDMANTSNIIQSLTTELSKVLSPDQLPVSTSRYADEFDKHWSMQLTFSCPDGKNDVVIVDGHLVVAGDHAGDVSAIAWLVSYVLSGNADSGSRYVVTEAALPPHLYGITDLLCRAVAPHVVVGLHSDEVNGCKDVAAIAASLMQSTPRDDNARARLKSFLIHDFLAPGRRHIVSNIVSPSLLAATLRCAYPALPNCANERVVTALNRQLLTLGLLDTSQISREEVCNHLFPSVESTKTRIKAACADPINIHLVDDNPDFLPILDSVLGLGCKCDQSLPDQDSTFDQGANVILFLDMRLVPTDEGNMITDSSGFLYAIDLARKHPEMPIVLFSSTQQRRLQDAVLDVCEKEGLHNLITRFSKPSLSAQGGLNAKSCLKSLKDLAGAGVEAVMMIEQSRAIRALNNGAKIVKEDPLYAPLYCHRWLEVLLTPGKAPANESPATSTYQDMELIREFAKRWAVHPQMAEALRVDVTEPQAGWVWALAVIRVWLATGKTVELGRFVGRLASGLVQDYNDVAVVEGIPALHPGARRDSVHDVLLWATGPESVALPVAIKTIIQHVFRKIA